MAHFSFSFSESVVCIWNHLSRRMTNQIDCAQIVKNSNSTDLSSLDESNDLTIDSILPTRMLVFIGLSTGHIIIVKSPSIQVLHTIHPFNQRVLHLFALSSCAVFQSAINESNDNRFITQFKYLQERFEQHRLNRYSARSPLVPQIEINDNDLDNISYMLALGYGAKACQSIPQLQNYSSDALFLQTWSLDDFIL